MKSKLLLLLVIVCANSSMQAQYFSWANNIGSTSVGGGGINANDMVVDQLGNTIDVGTFNNRYDFNPSANVVNVSTPPSTYLGFIRKLDPQGNFLWVKSLGTAFTHFNIANIVAETNGDLIMTGTYEGTIDFDPNGGVQNLTAITRDLFVLKLDANGNFLWVKTIGGNNWTFTGALERAISGGFYIGGSFSSAVDFDPGTATNSIIPITSDGFLLKLDMNGNFVWVKTLATNGSGGGGNATIWGVQEDATGNIFISGNYGGNTDFDPGTGQFNIASLNPQPPYYPVDGFVAKWTNTGNFIWAKSYGGILEEYPRGMVINNAGEVIVNGIYGGTADFNPDTNITFNLTASGNDAYFLKLEASGNFVWAKSLQGNGGYADVTKLVMDNAENIYCSGYYEGTTDFDLGIGVNNQTTSNSEVFVLKIDQNGNTVDADILVGTTPEKGKTIAIDNNDNIYSSGYFEAPMDFDPQATTYNVTPQHDYKWMYTFKWSQCITPIGTTLNITGCTNTINGQTYTANGTYYQLLQATNGCDSLLTINLTQSSSNTYIDTQACTGSYTLNGQTYTSSGNYVQNYTNAFGCDSNYYLTLFVGISSSSIQNITACDYYSSPLGGFYPTSGTYTEITPNSTGCDSIITINLTVNTSQFNTEVVTACDSITINGTTYFSSGSVISNYIGSNGCDSSVQTDYVINTSSIPTTITESACNSYSFNGNTYTSSGTYPHVFVNSVGCDSSVNLNLTVTNINTNITVNSNDIVAQAIAPTTYQWVRCPGYVIISGATSANYTPTSGGSYAVILSENGCIDTSICVEFIPLNILEMANSNNNVSIYPQPVNENLNIEFSKNVTLGKIFITNTTGQIIFESQIKNSKQETIDLSQISSGLYFLNYEIDAKVKTVKFIKE